LSFFRMLYVSILLAEVSDTLFLAEGQRYSIRARGAAAMESKYARWVSLTNPLGRSVPASMTQILYEAGPTAPTALFFWVGPTTRWVDPTQSHPEP
jgi:hypothetical protein